MPPGGTSLAALVNLTVGDSHALDDGQPLARLVVASIVDAAGAERPRRAEETRAV